MTEKIYYWGEERESVDPDQTFIEFKAKSSKVGESSRSSVHKRIVTSPPGKGNNEIGNREEDDERGGWDNKLDFLFSCISVSVGLGNVWRFPYLCYKNGGGAFLVTYGIAMIFCGIPIFFQEVAIGQYLGAGGMTLVGQLCPLLQGVGYATMTIVFFLDVYYCIIIAWTLFYLIATFTRLPELPWSNCGNWWNTDNCSDLVAHRPEVPPSNTTSLLDANNASSRMNFTGNVTLHHTTPVEEFWERRVLGMSDGIEEIGGMQWELLGCLTLGWLLVYLIIRRGLHQSGKVIWFSALFPYVVLFILLARAVTLEGARDGLLYYITPRWEELRKPGPWIDGATQIFFAYSIGTGALPALGSYNKFHHNCYKDALITCVVNTLTCLLAGCVTFSILGHIAMEQATEVSNVVKSGPGLVFITYPEVVLKLPGAPIWAAIFFIMLIILGIDSEFCIVESFITGVVDNWPETLRPHRAKFTIAICSLMFLLGIPMVTHGGVYIFQLMDFYSASRMSILWVCFFQTIAISWIFGAQKFSDCVHQMMGIRMNKFWHICLLVFAPVIMAFIFVFQCVQYTPLKYGSNYEYPTWAEVLGFFFSFSSMIWIPGYAIYYLLATPGTVKENFAKGLKPNIKSRAKLPKGDRTAVIPMSESSAGLITKNNSFLSQS
ncbi:sodium- and chloride-dependent GABA transporter 1-like [Venturia canescens]|uniref:sodium- and chloride-dependent GABA transporter 1-like n=1 Tax=Venturia canescens TaxID=32260 RepID=UPI001C9C84D7|nr:sodium- and chloride-dependent GABA transporter 1-like [Venturia canescens]XP_043281773.1 sodium- and chloride-dependent GABA transporter 1-like [Venturia canescens]XP_043281774.1 sodium- and chloride-dependent GABA transporter 1-like [Venturia canescens]XP_043281775.1 sodium- and chloride-dependent GABA transporter 1-like [Venturia canescens]